MSFLLAHAIEDSTDIFGISGGGDLNPPRYATVKDNTFLCFTKGIISHFVIKCYCTAEFAWTHCSNLAAVKHTGLGVVAISTDHRPRTDMRRGGGIAGYGEGQGLEGCYWWERQIFLLLHTDWKHETLRVACSERGEVRECFQDE